LLLNAILVPAGTPEVAERFMGVLNPPAVVVPCDTVAEEVPQVIVAGFVVLKKKAGLIALVMVKFVFDISKKMFPTASTLILAVEDEAEGRVTAWLPSLGVLAARTVGNVCPPSVERLIITFAQLTGANVLLATDHVTVCEVPPCQLTFVFGAVTANGPEVFETVTVISLNAVCPTFAGEVLYELLSRTVTLKFKVLVTELNASIFAPASPPDKGPVNRLPARIVGNRGKYLVGEEVGRNERKLGPVSFV
jgi:hypothetical protein